MTTAQPLRVPDWLVAGLLALPWLHPWAPGPQANTVPLLIGWGTLASLLALGRLPSARMLAQAWVGAALVSSVMGLLQYFGEAALLGGWVHVPAYLGDAVGNLRQRNQLATLTSIGVVAVLWWQGQGLSRPHALWMLALLALGNAATGSRTGLLQWLVLAALLALWQWTARPRPSIWSWPMLLWALGVYLLASLALPHALNIWSDHRVDSAVARLGELQGCGARGTLWRNVLHLIGQQPWTGWGWDEIKYAHYISNYPSERFCDILGHAHNLPLHLAVTLGIPAAALLCFILLGWLWRAQPWQARGETAPLAWGVLSIVGLHSLLEYPLWYSPFQLALLWSLWLLWPAGASHAARHRSTLQALGVGALCLIALIGLDYQRVRQIYLPAAQRTAWWQDDPWRAAQQTLFFRSAFEFARVTTTPVTPDNAAEMLQASQAMLHYSPEPRVIQKLIESARLTGHEDLARWHEAQQQAVYGASAR